MLQIEPCEPAFTNSILILYVAGRNYRQDSYITFKHQENHFALQLLCVFFLSVFCEIALIYLLSFTQNLTRQHCFHILYRLNHIDEYTVFAYRIYQWNGALQKA